MTSEIKIPTRVYRGATIIRAEEMEDDRTVEISFSSEEPYERWWGVEILGHNKDEVDLSFMESGNAPLLIDHKRTCDTQIGTIVKAWLDQGRGQALVRFGKSKRAKEFLERVKDGELTNISVGYEINKMRLESEDDDIGTYRIIDWKPLEASLVPVPADPTVGVGRSDSENLKTISLKGGMKMSENETPESNVVPVTRESAAIPAQPARNDEQPSINSEKLLKDERKRASEIRSIGSKFNMSDVAEKAIEDGTSVESFHGLVLQKLGDGAEARMAAANSVGLTEKEIKQFSFMKAARLLANPTDQRAAQDAAFEIEVSLAAQEKAGKQSKGIMVPTDVLRAPRTEGRALSYGNAAQAGDLVETELDPSSFIGVLRNRLKVQMLGATMLNDLTGDLDIPKQLTPTTAAWLNAEGADVNETNPSFGLLQFRLKTLGGYTEITRKMMQQASLDIESLVRGDLAISIAEAIDLATLHGTGTGGQPLGLANTTGIGAVIGGTNGAVPTWADIIDLETEVSSANADVDNMAYLTNARMRGTLKQTEKATDTAQFVWKEGGEMNGYKAEVSNQVRSDITKGSANNASAIFFGNWSDVIIAMWSGVDLMVDPYTNSLSGTTRLVVHQDCDIQFRRTQSFSAMLDALAA